MGVSISGSVIVNSTKRIVIRDGVTYKIPSYIKTNRISTVNGNVYIGGYELFPRGTWRKTVRAYWYCYFDWTD